MYNYLKGDFYVDKGKVDYITGTGRIGIKGVEYDLSDCKLLLRPLNTLHLDLPGIGSINPLLELAKITLLKGAPGITGLRVEDRIVIASMFNGSESRYFLQGNYFEWMPDDEVDEEDMIFRDLEIELCKTWLNYEGFELLGKLQFDYMGLIEKGEATTRTW